MTHPSRRCPRCGDRLPADRPTCPKCVRKAVKKRRPAAPVAPASPAKSRSFVRTWIIVAVAVIGTGSLGGISSRATPRDPAPPADVPADRTAAVVADNAIAAMRGDSTLTGPGAILSDTDLLAAGHADFQEGDFGSALARFQKVVDRDPDNADALNNAGQSLMQMNRAAEAVPLLERAVEARPSDATLRFNLAVALDRIGSLPRAVSEYEALARQSPSDPRVYHNLGLALRRLGRDDDATPAFQKATEMAPDLAAAWLGLALSLDRKGQADAAAPAFERFLALAPDSPDAQRIREHVARLRQAAPAPPKAP